MKILTRYVLREHAGPLAFALTALTSLLMLQYVARQLANLAGKGLPWAAIGKFFVLSLPFMIAMTMPMAVLVATLYAFGRMAAEQEVTAFKANGIRVRSLMMPVLIAAFLLSVFMVFFNDQVLSRSNHQLRVLQQDISRTKPALALRDQVLNTITEQFVIKVSHADAGTGRIRDVVIFDLSNPLERKTIYADSGRISLAPNGQDLQLELFDGYVQELVKGDSRRLQRTFFRTQLVRKRGISQSFETSSGDSYKGDREMSICELQQQYISSSKDYARLRDNYLKYAQSPTVGKLVLKNPRTRPAEQPLARAYCGAVQRVAVLASRWLPTTVADRSPKKQQPAPPASQTPAIGATPAVTPVATADSDAARMTAMSAVQSPVSSGAAKSASDSLAQSMALATPPAPPNSSAANSVTTNATTGAAAGASTTGTAIPPAGVPLGPPQTSGVVVSTPPATNNVTPPATNAVTPPPTNVVTPPPTTVVTPPQTNGVVVPPSTSPPAVNATGTSVPPNAATPLPPQTAAALAKPLPNVLVSQGENGGGGAVGGAVVVPPPSGAPPGVLGQVPSLPAVEAGHTQITPDRAQGRDADFEKSAFLATTTQLVEARLLIDSLSVEIHKKFALSFACLVFVLFGPPIALRFPRGGVGVTIGVSIAVFGLYYICLMGGEALADNGKLPPYVAMWIANVVFAAVGIMLLWRIEQTTDTSRGGGLREWWIDRKARRALERAERRSVGATATPQGA